MPTASPSFLPMTFGVCAPAALGGADAGPVGCVPRGNDEKNRNSAKRMARTARIATLLSKRGNVQPRALRVPPLGLSDDVESVSRSATSENARANAPALAYRRSGSVPDVHPAMASNP